MTNLLYTEDEIDLRDAVREAVSRHIQPADVATLYDEPQPFHQKLWETLGSEIGLSSLLIPEEYGGFGAGPREAAAVAEELGRAVAPVPFLTASVIATTILLECGDHSTIESLSDNTVLGVLALPFTARAGQWSPVELGTTISPVAGAHKATTVLIPLRTSSGELELRLYNSQELDVIQGVTSLDMSRPLASISGFSDDGGVVLARGDEAARAVDAGLLLGAGVLASEQYGLASRVLEMTLEYVKTRIQFARPIGSFQAIKHRLADLYLRVTSAGAAARYAAGTLADKDPDAPVAVALAQSYCSDAAVLATEEAVQLHGGNGMTWEFPIHVFLKRAKSSQLALGTPDHHRTDLGPLINLTRD